MSRMWNGILIFTAFLLTAAVSAESQNLSCYQCIRNVDEECGPEDLKKCPSIKDRCVTHISKDAKLGFQIKRECGLGPCGFDDDMVNKGLGMNCDRNKDEYFCLSCCKESGCNKSSAQSFFYQKTKIKFLSFVLAITLLIFLQ